ncbi:MAG: hypothetical protein ACYCZF_16395, partial [Anaerolineae bacterium]
LLADPTDVIPGLPLPGDWLRIDGTGGNLSTFLYTTRHVPCLTFEGHLAEGTQRSQHGRVDHLLLEEYIERHTLGLARLLAERL